MPKNVLTRAGGALSALKPWFPINIHLILLIGLFLQPLKVRTAVVCWGERQVEGGNQTPRINLLEE